MEVKVIKAFRDSHSADEYKEMDRYPKNSTFKTNDFDRIKELQKKGHLENVEVPEKKSKKVETADVKHVGGGVYELPDGERVKGKEEAEKAVKQAEKGE
ncbi:hypothetical protein [Salinicoccus roseus]|uniref:hypothetical protein n=1 Tax=Salinicoccus roseus TaxID=45670 RepID=UPI00117B3F22|nr:hypothetical protein [Salinicoccus roseus]